MDTSEIKRLVKKFVNDSRFEVTAVEVADLGVSRKGVKVIIEFQETPAELHKKYLNMEVTCESDQEIALAFAGVIKENINHMDYKRESTKPKPNILLN